MAPDLGSDLNLSPDFKKILASSVGKFLANRPEKTKKLFFDPLMKKLWEMKKNSQNQFPFSDWSRALNGLCTIVFNLPYNEKIEQTAFHLQNLLLIFHIFIIVHRFGTKSAVGIDGIEPATGSGSAAGVEPVAGVKLVTEIMESRSIQNLNRRPEPNRRSELV